MAQRPNGLASDRSLPLGWPKGVPLPTRAEARLAVRKGEEMVAAMAKARRGKLLRSDKEMDSARITI